MPGKSQEGGPHLGEIRGKATSLKPLMIGVFIGITWYNHGEITPISWDTVDITPIIHYYYPLITYQHQHCTNTQVLSHWDQWASLNSPSSTSSPRLSLQQLDSCAQWQPLLLKMLTCTKPSISSLMARAHGVPQLLSISLKLPGKLVLKMTFHAFRFNEWGVSTCTTSCVQQVFPQHTAFPTQLLPLQQVLSLGHGLRPLIPAGPTAPINPSVLRKLIFCRN